MYEGNRTMLNLLLPLIYLAFISLGLPDAVLGSAWPIISDELATPLSSMGIVTVIISAGTILSSLQSDRLTKKLGVQMVTAISVATTAIALLGFSLTSSFLMLCILAVPYGLGAGSVDAALNNYVAIHFESKHMSWLHCMWGIGATLGPYIMGMALSNSLGFRGGYTILFVIQAALTAILFFSRPVWKMIPTHAQNTDTDALDTLETTKTSEHKSAKALSFKEILKISGVPYIMVAFACVCGIEQTTGLWASSYLVLNRGVGVELAASFGALFFLGMTIGRGASGFIAMKYSDSQMIRGGQVVIALGIVALFLPFGTTSAFAGLILVGLGLAPIYPSIIHSTPHNFGAKNSQAIIGVQMASAYTGSLAMPAIFGLIADNISIALYPVYIGVMLLVLFFMYQMLLKKVDKNKS